MANKNNSNLNKNKKTSNENKRTISDEELIKLFDRFDNTKACGFITEYALIRFRDIPEWDVNLARKIKLLKKFVQNIQTTLNIKYKNLIGGKFSIEKNLFFYADPNMPQVYTRLKISQSGKGSIVPLSLNMPLDKLLRMSAFELYSILSASTYLTIQQMLKGKDGFVNSVDLNRVPQDKIDDLSEIIKDKAVEESNKRKAAKILAKYLEKILPMYCGGEFYEFDDISKVVAMDIVEQMPNESVEKIIAGLFYGSEEIHQEAVEKVAQFLGKDVSELRRNALADKALNLFKDENKIAEAFNASQQYQTLVSCSVQEQFAALVENSKNGRTNLPVSLEQFCQNYANTVMMSAGVPPIELTFLSNNDDLGTFVDYGTSQKININLKKIAEKGSICELVSTLSHELTHAIEAYANKSVGKCSIEGYGLQNNISNDISKTSFASQSEAFELLRTLNKYCYRINPNERSARYGELMAFSFLQNFDLSGGEHDKLGEMLKSYVEFQGETMDILKSLSNEDFVKDLRNKVNKVIASGVSENDRELLVSRIDYIEKIMSGQQNLEIKNTMEAKSLEMLKKYVRQRVQNQQLEQTAATMQM